MGGTFDSLISERSARRNYRRLAAIGALQKYLSENDPKRRRRWTLDAVSSPGNQFLAPIDIAKMLLSGQLDNTEANITAGVHAGYVYVR